MKCHAILTNQTIGTLTGKCCRSHSMNDSLFCKLHKKITPEEHKSRWIRMFILGADGSPFLYKYAESKKERILNDLQNQTIVLTKEDIAKIPSADRYIDIYILLIEAGIVHLNQNENPGLYNKCISYMLKYLFVDQSNRLYNFTPAEQKIRECLILKDEWHFLKFLQMLPTLQNEIESSFEGFQVFLEGLLDSDAARLMSWCAYGNNLLDLYEKELGKESTIVVYMRQHYFPALQRIYKEEKLKQKARTDVFKEELMIVCWHPDRFVDYCLDEEEKAEIKMLF